MTSSTRKLFTPSFILICLVNFCTFSAFNMLMPVIPLYLVEDLGLDPGYAGLIISLYAISALFIRPISGYMADALHRKKLFLCGGLLYGLSFLGYLQFTDPLALMAVRVAQGLTFGLFTTAGATLAIDIIPEDRLGTGLSLVSGISSLSMVMGPAAGMFLLDMLGYGPTFVCALTVACLCPLLGLGVKARQHPRKAQPLRLSSLFIRQGALAGVSLALSVCIYGLLMNFFSLYTREQGLSFNPGLFLAIMGSGLVFIRLFIGKFLDQGFLAGPLIAAKLAMLLGVILFLLLPDGPVLAIAAFLFGSGFGLIMPIYQLIFVRLAPEHQRGAANSSFFVALDGGIGASIMFGGLLAQNIGYSLMYAVGAGLLSLSILLFASKVWPDVRAKI